MEFKALFFDGKSPLEREIKVIWAGRSWVVFESELDWSLKNSTMEWQGATLHVLHKSGRESFIVPDFTEENAEGIGLQSTSKKAARQLRSALTIGLVTITTFIGLYAAIEPLSFMLAKYVSPEQEKRVFEHISATAYLNESRCTQWDAQKLMQDLADSLHEGETMAPTVEIIDWDMPNAFAFPGQKIYVTQALLNVLERPEHLLAVLAHEKGHVDLRHNVGGTISGLTKAYLWSVAFGDFSGGFLVDPKLAKDLSDASYSREHESEADAYAAELLDRQGHDPKALARALDSIHSAIELKSYEEDSKLPKMLQTAIDAIDRVFSTHPEFDERVKKIEAAYPEYKFRETLTKGQWLFLKEACTKK